MRPFHNGIVGVSSGTTDRSTGANRYDDASPFRLGRGNAQPARLNLTGNDLSRGVVAHPAKRLWSQSAQRRAPDLEIAVYASTASLTVIVGTATVRLSFVCQINKP